MHNPAFSTFILLNGEQVWPGIAVIYLWPRSQLSTCQLVAYRYFVTSPASPANRHWDSSLVARRSRAGGSDGLSLILSKNGLHVNVQWPAPTPGWHGNQRRGSQASLEDCDLFFLSFIGDQHVFKAFFYQWWLLSNAPMIVSGNRVSGIYGFEKLPSNHLLLISDRKDSSYHHKIAASRCFLCS